MLFVFHTPLLLYDERINFWAVCESLKHHKITTHTHTHTHRHTHSNLCAYNSECNTVQNLNSILPVKFTPFFFTAKKKRRRYVRVVCVAPAPRLKPAAADCRRTRPRRAAGGECQKLQDNSFYFYPQNEICGQICVNYCYSGDSHL